MAVATQPAVGEKRRPDADFKTLTVECLKLVDAEGQTRARLFTSTALDESVLEMLDSKGKLRLSIRVNELESLITVVGHKRIDDMDGFEDEQQEIRIGYQPVEEIYSPPTIVINEPEGHQTVIAAAGITVADKRGVMIDKCGVASDHSEIGKV